MKIAIDARLYGPEHAGNGRYTKNLVENLSRLDSNNKYVIFLRKNNFDTVHLPKNWTKVLTDFKHYTFAEQVKLPLLILKYSPDLVHFPHINVPLFYFGKYVTTVHDITMHKYKGGEATTRRFPIYQIWRLGYHVAFAKAVYGAKKIIVPTNYVKRKVFEFYKVNRNKLVVTPEGVDKAIVSGKSGSVLKKYNLDNKKYFTYVGSAYPHKNLKRLVQSFVKYKKDGGDAILAISSSRSVFADRLKKLIDKHNATSYIKLLGFVPDSELGVVLSSSISFVYPTLAEGFGLPGLESFASGTLVCCSDIPVLREVYGDNALYFDPEDVDSIAKTLDKAQKMSVAKRKVQINRSKIFVKKYSWEKLADKTLDVYRQFGN